MYCQANHLSCSIKREGDEGRVHRSRQGSEREKETREISSRVEAERPSEPEGGKKMKKKKNRSQAALHLPAECGNYPPLTQRDDRCTYRPRALDPSGLLVKINAKIYVTFRVMHSSWKLGGTNGSAGFKMDRSDPVNGLTPRSMLCKTWIT